MITKKETATLERNCVNMCKVEVLIVLIEMLKECHYSDQMEVIRICKEKISKLECVWKRERK